VYLSNTREINLRESFGARSNIPRGQCLVHGMKSQRRAGKIFISKTYSNSVEIDIGGTDGRSTDGGGTDGGGTDGGCATPEGAYVARP